MFDPLLIAVIGIALLFEFINGFHDTANAIATSVYTRALRPGTAIVLAAVMNFCGALVSERVAMTISKGLIVSEPAQYVILAALIGAVFVGVGAGLSVRAGGAPGGDDALAMSLSRILKRDIQWVYLFSDLVVLALSATYIPWQKLGYSLLTVLLSGQIIGWVQKIGRKAP